LATELKRQRVRFADFEFDCNSGDLRRGGISMKLQPQPAKVLAVLIRRAGEVVARQELAKELWGSNIFVDFEQGLNYAIRQIRTVLGDDAEQPRFLETLPKRGYRFIAPLEDQVEPKEVRVPATAPERSMAPRRTAWQVGIALIMVIVTGIAFVVGFRLRGRVPPAMPNHPITSLAVLPLHNLSHDPDQEYFSDGMTEELITDLAKSARLRVISHTSVQRYKDTNRSLPEIARELGVDAIVEGAVLRSNDRVRITAQLIDARSDQHLWADSYEGDLRDMLSLQDEVAQRIATQVGIKMQAGQETRVPTRQVNSAAYEAYLKGNFYWNRSTCDGSNKGRSFYQQAVAQDPTFAPAYAGLAQAYFVLGDWGCLPREEAFSKSKAAALKALELDPTSGPAHAWLGTLAYFHDWDWNNADKEYSKAVDLDPNYAPAHLLYAVFLVSMGRQARGLGEMRMAQKLDPTAELTNMVSVHILYLARQYDQAIEQAKNALEFYPDSWGTYFWLGAAYERKGMYDQAIQAYLKSRSLQGTTPDSLKLFRRAYQKEGIRGYWKRERDTLQVDSLEMCSIRSIYAQFDSKERTLEYLNRSIEHHCDNIRTLKVDSFYDDLREDPQFKELLVRLHFN
jgi:TolB-like protein/DNA-binding winged helix-turn-helix (wHTH) protein/Tfp pilus assembly protein PilF